MFSFVAQMHKFCAFFIVSSLCLMLVDFCGLIKIDGLIRNDSLEYTLKLLCCLPMECIVLSHETHSWSTSCYQTFWSL